MTHPFDSQRAADHPFAERQQPFAHAEATLEASRCLYCYDAPCMEACPTSIDIPGFIRSIATGDDLSAARTILSANPLGASCARVCETDALCEGDCVLGPTGKPIEIGRLQRHATDALVGRGLDSPWAAGKDTGRNVGIVGGGPAGLAAATVLRSEGHAVTIYDRAQELGGLGRYGIIPLRQPNEVVAWEVAQVRRLGITEKLGVHVGNDLDVNELAAQHDALLVTTGAGHGVLDIGIEGGDARGVEDALRFIEQSRTREPGDVGVGKNVVVVGGGNTAMDAATIAVKLGVNVTVVYRRTKDDMTAYPTEVEFCLGEGVHFRYLTQPVAVETDENGAVTGLVCVDVIPGELDESGRPRPTLGTDRFVVPCDQVLLATGQSREPGIFEALGADVTNDGRAVIANWETTVRGVFAAGDVVSTGAELSVVDAVEQGKQAAWSISSWLATHEPAVSHAGSRDEA